MERYLQTESALQALLVLLPESVGGLSCIAAGLFHSSPVVRLSATHILMRMKEHRSTECAVHSLNKMFMSAFDRQSAKLASGALQKEVEDAMAEAHEHNRIHSRLALDKHLFPALPPRSAGSHGKSSSHNDAHQHHQQQPHHALDGIASSDEPSLTTLFQQTLDGFLAGGEEQTQYHEGFSNTIDELDLIP